jgi:hypothetical protein
MRYDFHLSLEKEKSTKINFGKTGVLALVETGRLLEKQQTMYRLSKKRKLCLMPSA